MIGTNSMEDKNMKKITFAILAIAFIAAFNSCNGTEEIQTPEEDDWEYVVKQYDETTPHTPGTFVMFGANTYFKNGVEETRTKYAEEYPNGDIIINNKKYERIDWIAGDMIQIFCNQSSSALDAVYDINAATIKKDDIHEEQSVAAVTLKSGEQGLKWGTDNPHIFHGIYPPEGTITDVGLQYPQVTNRVQNGPGYSGQALKFITTIPTTQPYPVDMRLAGMVATTKAQLSEAGNVTMIFYPIVTTLQFDLKNVSKSDITIKKIYIYAPKDLEGEEIDITGKYDVTVSDNPEVAPVFQCDPQKGYLTVNNINQTLPISEPNKTVRVVMFALPEVFTGAKLAINMIINGQEVTRMVALNEKKTVTVTNEDNTTTTTTVKEDIVFQPTHKYNFTIKIPESTVFEVKEDKDFDVPGGTAPITVTSYTYDKDGIKTPLAWTATRYSIDGKEVGAEGKQWFTFNENALKRDAYNNLPTLLEEVNENVRGWGVFSTVGDENKQAVTQFNAVVAYNKPPYRKLKEAAPAEDVDLSTVDVNGNPYPTDKPVNTANCYMVHASGTYRFPVVYGNAIKDGEENTMAFNPTIDRPSHPTDPDRGEIQDSIAYNPPESVINRGWGGVDRVTSHFLSPFINHNGEAINSPYISGALGAKLIWQDAKGLITNVGYSGGYVTFTVTNNMAHLVEGNALIAVTSGENGTGDILWSWHIWITEMTDATNVGATADAFGGVYSGQTQASTIMAKELVDNAIPGVKGAKIAGIIGLCDISVGPKKITIEFVQEGTNATEYVTLTQKGRFNVNAPMYQYGRKDPLQFQKGLYEQGAYPDVTVNERRTNKTFYDIEGNVVSNYSGGAASMKGEKFPSEAGVLSSSIKNPDTFCLNASMDGKYYNLWAARLTRPGRYDALRADKTKTIYDPSPAGYRVPALADVAGWAGNNNSFNGVKRYPNLPDYLGRVSYNSTGHYVKVDLYETVFYPILAGRRYSSGIIGSKVWEQTEAASWVSTPNFFTSVAADAGFTDPDTPFTNEEHDGQFPQYDAGTYHLDRHSEDFYWYYHNDHSLNTRWGVAAGSCYQIRFNAGRSWMNEAGGSRGNAVNILMVKERDDDTSSDVYPSNP